MHKQNVALVGYMRSGKDSIAAYLIKHHGYKRISFADVLKEEVIQALNADGSTWTMERLNNEKLLVRPLLQWWGTEYRRSADPEYWVRQAAKRILGEQGPWVCTDARFTNELDMLKEASFRLIELRMPLWELENYLTAQGKAPAEVDAILNHPSERQWQDYLKDEAFLSHFGNLPELADKVSWYLNLAPQEHGGSQAFFASMYPEQYSPLAA